MLGEEREGQEREKRGKERKRGGGEGKFLKFISMQGSHSSQSSHSVQANSSSSTSDILPEMLLLPQPK